MTIVSVHVTVEQLEQAIRELPREEQLRLASVIEENRKTEYATEPKSQLRLAAEELLEDYETDSELTA